MATSTQWYSPAVHALLKRHGADNPVALVETIAHQIVDRSGQQYPPFNPAHMARLCGVKLIRQVSMSQSGRIVPVVGGFVIELNISETRPRKRFTCAHEVAHTFFATWDSSEPQERVHARLEGYDGDKEVERLCDIAAAAMLMPSRHLKRVIEKHGFSLTMIEEAAKVFDVSLPAVAIRVGQGGFGAAIVMWRYKSRPGSTEKLRVDWAASPRGIFIPKFDTCPIQSSIYKCFQEGVETCGIEKLDLGSLRGKFFVESTPIESKEEQPRQVLSVIHVDYPVPR